MANWEKLNKEFDDLINNMTDEDWKNWNLKREKRMIQKQAETYAKSIAKNETYQRYLAAAFIAGAESKGVDSPITKEALLERGFKNSCKTNIGCFYERSGSGHRMIEVTIYNAGDVTIFITDIRDGDSIPFPENRTLEQLDSLIKMFLGC